ncbi:S-adenosyl-L-methionine-dependent methyltransferase superfamily protein, partial [Zea mays]
MLAFLSPRAHRIPVPVPPATSNLSSSATAAISAQVAAMAREVDATRLVPHRASVGDGTGTTLPPELILFLSPHALPLGRDARTGLTPMPATVTHACFRSWADLQVRRCFGSPSTLALLDAFATYAPHAACPRDATLAHRLVSKACEPLPRCRCLSWGPRVMLPASNMGVDGRRWVRPRHGHEFLVDDVLCLAAGKIQTGLDVSGGAANFAAQMREREDMPWPTRTTHCLRLCIFTTVLDNVRKPMNEFMAARGLFPLLLSPAHRFPFYDGVFDLVHVGATALAEGGSPTLGQAGTEEALEFFMFDVDRVLRAGGLLWIDSHMCHADERRQALARLIG